MRDLFAGNLKFTSEGDDTHGYCVFMQSLGAEAQAFFTSREDGHYKIVASGTDTAEVGNYAAQLLRKNRDAEAVNLLDWKRGLVHRGGGHDPLAGDLSSDTPQRASRELKAIDFVVKTPSLSKRYLWISGPEGKP